MVYFFLPKANLEIHSALTRGQLVVQQTIWNNNNNNNLSIDFLSSRSYFTFLCSFCFVLVVALCFSDLITNFLIWLRTKSRSYFAWKPWTLTALRFLKLEPDHWNGKSWLQRDEGVLLVSYEMILSNCQHRSPPLYILYSYHYQPLNIVFLGLRHGARIGLICVAPTLYANISIPELFWAMSSQPNLLEKSSKESPTITHPYVHLN